MSDSKRGEINGWLCDHCGQHTYCVPVHDGVTPMFLSCRTTAGCLGTGTSLMYPVPPIPEHARYEKAIETLEGASGMLSSHPKPEDFGE